MERRSLGIHEIDETGLIPADMLTGSQAGVIRRHDQHGLQQIFQPKNLTGSQTQMRLVCARRLGADRHLVIQMAILQDDQGRHDLGQTGRGQPLFTFKLVESGSRLEFLEQDAMRRNVPPSQTVIRLLGGRDRPRIEGHCNDFIVDVAVDGQRLTAPKAEQQSQNSEGTDRKGSTRTIHGEGRTFL